MDACILVPIVKNTNSQSKFYKELFNLTGKDRALTNLLYALSLQDEIKQLFGPSDLNSQGEPTVKAFKEKINLDAILDSSKLIDSKAVELGAINLKGEVIYYDDFYSILQPVLNFNAENATIKANIKYSKEGFYIEVDRINANNFSASDSLLSRVNITDSLLNLFRERGLNTNLSEDSKKVMNPLNVYYVINSIKKAKGSQLLVPTMAGFFLDLFRDTPLSSRVIDLFGVQAAEAVAQVSGYTTDNPIELSENQIDLIKRFINYIQGQLKVKLPNSELDAIIEQEGEATTTLNADNKSLSDTLKDLYSKYHIDQETLDLLGKNVTKVSEAAQQMLQIQLALANEQKLKYGDKFRNKKFATLQKRIDNASYLDSIASMLGTIERQISNLEKRYAKSKSILKKSNNTLVALNYLSRVISEQLELADAYEDVLLRLSKDKVLEDDTTIEEEHTLTEIKEQANTLRSTLETLKLNARKAQLETITAFLKKYWGEDKVLPDDTVVKLSDIIESARHDVNIFDRFLYAMNTSNDEMMALLAEAVKSQERKRDRALVTSLHDIRSLTQKLFASGSDTSFIYEKDENGNPYKIISDYDYARYDRELEAYKKQIREDKEISASDYDYLEAQWCYDHSQVIEFPYTDSEGSKVLRLSVPIYEMPTSVRDRLTAAQYEYYQAVMNMKAQQIAKIKTLNNNTLFDVIEITTDLASTLTSPEKAASVLKRKLKGIISVQEDETEYGSILDANGIKLKKVNYKGQPIDTIPLFYTRKIEDRSKVSTDFSRAMVAYMSATEQYLAMDEVIDSLLLVKDYMLNVRKGPEASGNRILADMTKVGKKTYVSIANKLGAETGLNAMTTDFFERTLFGQRKKDEGYIPGTKIRVSKAVDAIVGYSSVTGLTVNTLGATANVLVGKIQMLIEAGGGEFFGWKDLGYASAKYYQLLPQLLNEISSNNKKSLLGLLMQKFNVSEDFYEKIAETGFYKHPISKIIGNRELFFLYGMGEHLLHAEGMLAVLHNKNNKVLLDGREIPLIEAFKVDVDETGNGTLVLKDGVTDLKGNKITEEYLEKIQKRISYVNKSMHGAFNNTDKGLIHKYAAGRLIMNFRQWMPAHYSRRFRGLHYDSDLDDYREGYYVTAFKFLYGVGKELKRAKFPLSSHWKELHQEGHEMELANLKRTITEAAILAATCALISLIGGYKDHKGNWAARILLYQLQRMRMEIKASSPLGGPLDFFNSMKTILQSPFAALKATDNIAAVIDLTNIFTTIEHGKYNGENLWLHNLKTKGPFIRQINQVLSLGTDDGPFMIFDT